MEQRPPNKSSADVAQVSVRPDHPEGAETTGKGQADLRISAQDLNIDSSWDPPRYLIQWPTVPAHKALSEKIRQTATEWRTTYTDAMRGSRRASFTSTWLPVLNAAGIAAVRLTAETVGADSATETISLYGGRDKQWSSEELLKPEARTTLRDLIQDRVSQSTGETWEPGKSDSEIPPHLFQDLSFTTTGDLEVKIGPGILASMAKGSFLATVHRPDAFLSPLGEETKAAFAEQSRSRPHGTSAASPPATPEAPHINCAVKKCLALTFDDGPGPYTAQILQTLRSKNAKATFFMLGPAAQSQPGLVRQIADQGMDIGDHSWTHPQFTQLSPAQVKREIDSQAEVIRGITGRRPIGVRPPYGAFNRTTPREGFPFILWDVDTEDWKNRNAAITTQRALAGARRGSIILMHDIHPSTAKALPGIIDQLQQQGYSLVTISDLMPNMSPNGAYYSATGN
ncbi:polysaccharide deacetylase family protein [Arthrobacter woluwensis]|uniref:polysaccharide deacetylase family protein n=1 Tax=Arthrobacter woluwensis TaxID=156980 RepID=UPI003817B6B3